MHDKLLSLNFKLSMKMAKKDKNVEFQAQSCALNIIITGFKRT